MLCVYMPVKLNRNANTWHTEPRTSFFFSAKALERQRGEMLTPCLHYSRWAPASQVAGKKSSGNFHKRFGSLLPIRLVKLTRMKNSNFWKTLTFPPWHLQLRKDPPFSVRPVWARGGTGRTGGKGPGNLSCSKSPSKLGDLGQVA